MNLGLGASAAANLEFIMVLVVYYDRMDVNQMTLTVTIMSLVFVGEVGDEKKVARSV